MKEARAWALALGIRLAFAAVAVGLPLVHPHIWRQVDTLGVSLRYWLRWTVEPESPWPLLPAILHSGDGSGIMAMEWPFLNLLAAPLFAFGPAWGTALARVLVLSLCMGLVLWNLRIWKGLAPAGVDAPRSFQWMPLLGLGLVFFPKFIPDGIAMLLGLAASGFLYQGKARFGAGLLLLSGLLMKPTAVIVLALLLLSPQLLNTLRSALLPVSFAFILTALYYMKGTSWIQSLAGGESLYRVEPQHPMRALIEFFSEPSQLGDLLLQGLAFYAALPLLFGLALTRRIRPQASLWVLLMVQIMTIGMLDGSHAFQHRYYFMGTLPFICLILQAALDDLQTTRGGQRLRLLLLLLALGTGLSQLSHEWRPLFRPTAAERFPSFQDCEELKRRLPDWPWHKGEVFRTTPRPYPLVGLCFGERVGSERSAYGLYLESDPLPASCKEVERVGHVVAARCTF